MFTNKKARILRSQWWQNSNSHW